MLLLIQIREDIKYHFEAVIKRLKQMRWQNISVMALGMGEDISQKQGDLLL